MKRGPPVDAGPQACSLSQGVGRSTEIGTRARLRQRGSTAFNFGVDLPAQDASMLPVPLYLAT
jgi:hypothetical protein